MRSIIGMVAVALAATASVGAQQRIDSEAFAHRVEAYAALHRRLEKAVGPEEAFVNPATMLAASDALRTSLAWARAGAREGDLFAPLAVDLALRVRRALRANGIESRDLLAEMTEDTEGDPTPLAVNARFSWQHGNVMLPCILEELPPLPGELEYRLVGTHLVLVDVHADMVVDILRNVLPARTTR